MQSPPVLNCNVASVATWTSCAPRSVSATQSHSVVVYCSVCHYWLHYASFISFLKTLPRWPLRWQMPAAQHPGPSTAPLLSRSLQSGCLSMLLRGSGFCRLRCTSALTAAGQEVSHRCSLWATWISHGASATHNQQNTRPSSCHRRPYHAPGTVAEYWIALSVCSRNWGQNPGAAADLKGCMMFHVPTHPDRTQNTWNMCSICISASRHSSLALPLRSFAPTPSSCGPWRPQ